MTKTIWKYPLLNDYINTIFMPKGAHILCVQNQDNIPTIWAMHNATVTTKVLRTFYIYGTGHNISSDNLDYIGTVQINNVVWHIFEELAC